LEELVIARSASTWQSSSFHPERSDAVYPKDHDVQARRRSIPILAALSLALSGPCLAAEETAAAVSPLMGLGQMLAGLAAVLVILVAFVWLLKRFSTAGRGNHLMRVIGAAPVGPRERVVLLEIGDKIILLGVTPNNVRTLHIFGRGELSPPPATGADGGETSGENGSDNSNPAAAFASRLHRALQGRRHAP
jgi:flagellar protein FliO/FliZ